MLDEKPGRETYRGESFRHFTNRGEAPAPGRDRRARLEKGGTVGGTAW